MLEGEGLSFHHTLSFFVLFLESFTKVLSDACDCTCGNVLPPAGGVPNNTVQLQLILPTLLAIEVIHKGCIFRMHWLHPRPFSLTSVPDLINALVTE